MAKNMSPELMLYVAILFSLIFLAAAGFVHVLLRRAFVRHPIWKPTPWENVVARLSFPLGLLAVFLIAKWPAFREALPLSPRYFEILDAVFVFAVLFFLVRLMDALIQLFYGRKGRPFPLPRVLHGFILLVIYLAVVFAVLDRFLRINIKPLLAGSAILTAVIGLALQGVLSNILAGMSLHYTKSFSRGDWIRVGDTEGVVVDTNWRETRIIDAARNIIIFPNSEVASRTITNYSLPDSLVEVVLPVKTGFDAPPAAVLEALDEAAREVPDVVLEPPPKARVAGYNDFGMSYVLKVYIGDYSRKDDIIAEIARLIWYKFRRRGIEVPFPIESKLRQVLSAVRPDDRAEAAVAEQERNSQDLARSSFLRAQEGEKAGAMILSEEEIRDLASRARRVAFAAKEVLFRQGQRGENCYLVASGKVRGEISYEEDGKKYTTDFEIGPGGIVGEMSLFTGIPRTATVVVCDDAELLEVGAEAFAGLLERNPTLAEAVAEIVSSRNRTNLEMLRKIKELSSKDLEGSTNKKSILEYLKKLVHMFKR
ncbi:MAG: cyclic nucleotide-binding domain-containing protein [Candidatus Aminicenantales bacterium]